MQVLLAFLMSLGLISGFYAVKPFEDGAVSVRPVDGISVIEARAVTVPEDVAKFDGIVRQQHDYSCGSAALATLLVHHFGEKFSEPEVIKGLIKYGDREQIRQRRAFSFLDMQYLMSALGYQADGYKATLDDLKNPEVWPCIAAISIFDYRHFVVVRGVYKNRVVVADPWFGNMSYSMDEFEKSWYQQAVFIIDAKGRKNPFAKGLKLAREDLRIIDEDDTRIRIKDFEAPFGAPESRRLEDITGARYQYRR